MYLGVEEGIYRLMDGLKMNINKPALSFAFSLAKYSANA